jgi:hypothetical protein
MHMNRSRLLCTILAACAGCGGQIQPAEDSSTAAAHAPATNEPATAATPTRVRNRKHAMPLLGAPPQAIASAEPSPSSETVSAESTAPIFTGNGINYRGGSVMKWTPTVYLILYGNWGNANTNSSWAIFTDWAKNIGTSSYWGINTTYYDKSGNHVMNSIRFGGTAYDATYSHGKSLSEDDIEDIVNDAISNNVLPHDNNGVYFVLTAADVTEGKFCSVYCGYHNHTGHWYHPDDIKYVFIGNPARCMGGCADGTNQNVSPNDNPIADAMVSVMTHELEESVSDPDLDAWSNSNTGENGDLCVWNFGATQSLPNGSRYNVTWGNRNFLVQQDWINVNGGGCALSYPHDTLLFDSTDSRLSGANGDWKPNSYKAECAWRGAVTGVSQTPSTRAAHSVFCTDAPSWTKFSHQNCRTVDFSAGDNRGTTSTGDWDGGFPKGECAPNEYVAGVSQRTNGFVDSLLCCQGEVAHNNCTPHYFWNGGSREDNTSGDWDYGFNKSDCGPGRYVAGVARDTRPGQPGGPDAILCCE